MNDQKFLEVFRQSIKSIEDKRYFSTERGYQAELYCQLKERLNPTWIQSKAILEVEYQKTEEKHGIKLRPDIVLHVPFESGQYNNRLSGNYIVIELKLRANERKAKEDFKKLNSIFQELNYPLGIFLNINSDKTFCDRYFGNYGQRLHCFAVKLANNEVIVKYEKPSTPSR